MSLLTSGQATENSLSFTPMLKSQIEAGRRRGGNLIDTPLANYAVVTLQTQFGQDVKEVPQDVEQDILSFIDQQVFLLSIPGHAFFFFV